ncbi:MAG: TonB-dependent receptor [Sphingomonadales bacterium]|nr:TonB-dependent receptor [Sphingomonadales bacterium]
MSFWSVQLRAGLSAVAVVSSIAVAAPAAAQVKRFDLAAQPAAAGVAAFARQADVQVLISANDARGRRTNAVRGTLTVGQALDQLLRGSGLVARMTGSQTYTVVPAPPAEVVPAAVQDIVEADPEPILVTGSRIRTTIKDAPAPVSVVQATDILGKTGRVALGDELNELPQFRSTLSQASSTGNQPPSQVGLNQLDLRGLGTSRTLVLQNGRRHVSGSQVVWQPDTNAIPVELLDHVEILTGGASAVYGADAIAGVVNFVVKDDFEGISIRGQGGISERGDAGAYMASITAGTNFDGGRGNVAASVSFSQREQLRYNARSFSRNQASFVPNILDTDRTAPPGTPPDGIPDQILIRKLRLLANSNGGTIVRSTTTNPPAIYRFAPDGSLNLADFGNGHFLPLAPVSDGGDGLNSIGTATLLPDNRRVAVNLLGHYDLTDGIRLFAEGKMNWQRASTWGQGTASALTLSTDNPFLSAQARGVLATLIPGGGTFSMNRVHDDIGVQGERTERTTWRGVVGLKGELSDRWNFEISYNYGRTDITSDFLNSIYPARIALAADAVRDTAGVLGTPGAIVCRARLQAGGVATGNANIDTCVAANFFGNGAVSEAARNYLSLDTRATGRLQQHVVGGFVSGDTGGFLTLPGGPVKLVAGFEYRDESTRYSPDARDLAGVTSFSGFQPIAGSLDVLEGYGEVKLPLLADVPGARLLEVSGAVRVAKYSLAGVGTEVSWGGGAVYEPLDGLRLRGSYQRAARAPNLAELFQPTVGTRFSVFDPCSVGNINQGTSTRAANCLALGIPAGFVASTIGSTVPGSTGGNPDLDVEKGTTWTMGLVLNPRFLPGFSLTADYYNIKLTNAITSIPVNTIINQCVDSPTIANVFCPLITRNATTHDIVDIAQRAVNLTKLTASGVDVEARYGFPVGAARIDLRAVGSYVIKRDDYLSPTQPDFPTQQVETVSRPRLSMNFGTTLTLGAVSIDHDLRYFSSQYRGPVANFESVGGQPPLNPDSLPPEYRKTGDRFIHDVRLGLAVADRGEFYFGIDNLFDNKPPPGIYAAGFGGANFDNVGRFFYSGVSFKF